MQQQVLADNAAEVGTTVESLQAGSTVTTAFLRGDAEKAGVAEAVGFVFVFLFYFAALVFGMQLASSVIEEKQSRIVEIIAAAIPLRHLLAGKVLGNTALAVIQLMVYLVVGLVGLSFTSYKSYVPALSGPTAWFIGFFLAGFIALACLWAVAGSLASRTEDLQATSTPLTMLMLVMFFGGLSLDGRGTGDRVVRPARLGGRDAQAHPGRRRGVVGAAAGPGPAGRVRRGHRVDRGAPLPPGAAADRRSGQPPPGVVRGRVTRR